MEQRVQFQFEKQPANVLVAVVIVSLLMRPRLVGPFSIQIPTKTSIRRKISQLAKYRIIQFTTFWFAFNISALYGSSGRIPDLDVFVTFRRPAKLRAFMFRQLLANHGQNQTGEKTMFGFWPSLKGFHSNNDRSGTEVGRIMTNCH